MHWSCCDTADLSREDLQQAYLQLSPSRKEHIDRLRQPEDKVRSLAGELLVHRLLQEHYGITDAVLHRKENGQPYLKGCDLHVSIAHCERMVACAISSEPVGIDVERIRPIKPDICRHVCTQEEKAYVLAGCQRAEEIIFRKPEVLRRFFEIWTAKEAYFKKCGTGITDLKSVDVMTLQPKTHVIGDYILQIL